MKPIRYKVLLIDQMSKEDKLVIASKVTTIFTGPEARANGFKQIEPGKFVNPGWQVENRDTMGHVVVMKYKGVEAALFYKRQTGEVEPLPVDPVPEGVITDPDDAWVRLDLLGLSAKESGGRVGKQKKKSDENLILAEQNLALKEQLVGILETEIFNLKKDLEKKDEEIAKLKAAAKPKFKTTVRCGVCDEMIPNVNVECPSCRAGAKPLEQLTFGKVSAARKGRVIVKQISGRMKEILPGLKKGDKV